MILVSLPSHSVMRACKDHFGRYPIRLRRQSIRSWVAYRGQLSTNLVANVSNTAATAANTTNAATNATTSAATATNDLLLFVGEGSPAQTAAIWGYMIGRFGEPAPLVACHIDWLATPRLCLLYRICAPSGGRSYYSDLLANPGLPEAETTEPRSSAFGEMAMRLLSPHQWHCLGLPAPTADDANGHGADSAHTDFVRADFDLLVELLIISASLQRQTGYTLSAAEREYVRVTAQRLRLSSYQNGQMQQKVHEYCVRFGHFPQDMLERTTSIYTLTEKLRADARI